MSRCQCEEIESLFDKDLAEDELSKVRRRGPARTTRWLLEAIRARGVTGGTLLDIGGGVGTIQHQLLSSGLATAVHVDAASGYLKVAQKEARRLKLDSRITFHHGNFVDLAPGIEPADIVTLDRVICCYDDVQGLVSTSAAKARRLYGAVYPRDTWWTNLGAWLLNSWRRMRKDNFRIFHHPTRQVESLLAEQGLKRTFHRRGFYWQVALFEKERA